MKWHNSNKDKVIMIIYVDIDETICNTIGNKHTARDYSLAEPIADNIEKINMLYKEGHTIIYWTARGTGSKIDWSDVTKKQFKKWNIKFHDVRFGKPAYDLFIDDKAINSLDLDKNLEKFTNMNDELGKD